MGGSDRRVSGLGRHPADGPRSRPRPFFWQFSASIKSLQRKQCIIKKWSTQAYQKAYQIRPSPLRRKWSVQVAGAKRPATLPDWRNPGAECQRRRSRERATRSHAQPAGRAWRGLRTPTLDTALRAAPPVKQTDIGPSGPVPLKGFRGTPRPEILCTQKHIWLPASRGQIAHVAWQRISAPFVKTVEPSLL